MAPFRITGPVFHEYWLIPKGKEGGYRWKKGRGEEEVTQDRDVEDWGPAITEIEWTKSANILKIGC